MSISVFLNKPLLEHSYVYLFMYCKSIQGASRLAMTETIWPEILPIWSFTKKVCWSLYRAREFGNLFNLQVPCFICERKMVTKNFLINYLTESAECLEFSECYININFDHHYYYLLFIICYFIYKWFWSPLMGCFQCVKYCNNSFTWDFCLFCFQKQGSNGLVRLNNLAKTLSK
jgi:hypothetical protein